MPEEEMPDDGMEMVAPAPPKKKGKMIMLIIILVLGVGVLLVLLLTGNKEAEIEPSALLDEIPVVEVEVEIIEEELDEFEVGTYIGDQVSFDYPIASHVTISDSFKDDQIVSTIRVNAEPIYFCAACDGSYSSAVITITPKSVLTLNEGQFYVDSIRDSYDVEDVENYEETTRPDGSVLVSADVPELFSGLTNAHTELSIIFETDDFVVMARRDEFEDFEDEDIWELLLQTLTIEL